MQHALIPILVEQNREFLLAYPLHLAREMEFEKKNPEFTGIPKNISTEKRLIKMASNGCEIDYQ